MMVEDTYKTYKIDLRSSSNISHNILVEFPYLALLTVIIRIVVELSKITVFFFSFSSTYTKQAADKRLAAVNTCMEPDTQRDTHLPPTMRCVFGKRHLACISALA